MQVPFDLLAENYDVDFTETAIGKMQRTQVIKYLDSLEFNHPEAKILEINCGTGTDALYFSKRGLNITATDISSKMVAIAEKKGAMEQQKIRTLQCDMLDIGKVFKNEEFDLIFSNFGGLNCISPTDFTLFAKSINQLLKPEGQLIGVLMPRFCFWDSLYFFTKLKFRSGTRRWSVKKTIITFKETIFPIWYYNPGQLSKFFNNSLKVRSIKPIGLFVPPSYLNGFFSRHPKFLKILGKMEFRFENYSWLSSFADHYLINLIKVG
jgi:ubiquinone/menaquinone biosynthesis C-methylase UbiE